MAEPVVAVASRLSVLSDVSFDQVKTVAESAGPALELLQRILVKMEQNEVARSEVAVKEVTFGKCAYFVLLVVDTHKAQEQSLHNAETRADSLQGRVDQYGTDADQMRSRISELGRADDHIILKPNSYRTIE